MNPNQKREHFGKSSRFNLKNAFWVVMAITFIGGLITNASRIMDAVWLLRVENADSINIPPLAVKLNNNGSEAILLPCQGLCFLWPPEPHKWDYEGGYEFKRADGTDIESDIVLVPAGSAREVQIHLKRTAPIHQTKTSMARFFVTGNWHVQFLMITNQNGRNLISSARIPFTTDAMSKSYVFEVFRMPFQKNSLN